MLMRYVRWVRALRQKASQPTMPLLVCLVCLGGVGVCFFPALANEVFQIDALPPGSDVTINSPATTHVPLGTRVRLWATDAPQSVKFTVVSPGGAAKHSIKVAIYDAQQEKVRYVTVRGGDQQPALYSFQGLTSIFIIPETDEVLPGHVRPNVALQITSDKPLKMAH